MKKIVDDLRPLEKKHLEVLQGGSLDFLAICILVRIKPVTS